MVFKYDPGIACADLERSGCAHLKDILDDRFRDHLRNFYHRSRKDDANEQRNWKIAGKKRQYLFDFPSREDTLEFRDGMSRLTGIAAEAFTISERHLKVYEEGADPWPAPHKDRAASEISIGLPIAVAEGSTACVFPDFHVGPNTQERAIFLSSEEYGDVANIYETENAVMLNEQFGDIIVFRGSAIFHERINAAGTAILYIKINRLGQDPLGENLFGCVVKGNA